MMPHRLARRLGVAAYYLLKAEQRIRGMNVDQSRTVLKTNLDHQRGMEHLARIRKEMA